jgi:3'-5' exoribonuclease
MSRRFVNQLSHQEQIDQVFLAANKQLRPNRNGNLFLQVDLSDRTGSLAARLWNANDTIYRGFDDGDFVRVEGTAQVYQGAMQIIATHIERAAAHDVEPEDFVPLAAVDLDRLTGRLREMLRGMADPHLRTLAECFLVDETFMGKFTRAPAGVKNHHAYHGGLLEHVVNLMEVTQRVAPLYPAINADLLLMGAFVHDMGKIDELGYERTFSYTDEGQLIGHVVMAVGMLEEKVREAERLAGEPVPADLVLRLKHIIVSHHGEYEFGAPKLPMTLEAIAIHCLDNLDAKLFSFQQQMRDDANADSTFTSFNPQLNRKLYKGK